MEDKKKSLPTIEQVGQGLFDFALERDDIKWLLARLQIKGGVKPATVEYELQILKIIGVGWSIAYLIKAHPWKTPLQDVYWQSIWQFAQNLSTTTELMIGQDVDYFQVLKERLDGYVATLENNPGAQEPVQFIGPAFALNCGDREDLMLAMTGSKIFASVLSQVKSYLTALELC